MSLCLSESLYSVFLTANSKCDQMLCLELRCLPRIKLLSMEMVENIKEQHTERAILLLFFTLVGV